jgi:hypothetical protein
MKSYKKTLFASLLLLVLCMPAGFADAARISQLTVSDSGDFVLEPGKIEIFLNPGETAEKTISIISRVNRKVDFKIETEDFIGSDDPQSPVLLLGKDKSPYSFKDNLIPELQTFTLDFGQKIEIPIKITVPENAQPGGFYSSVIVSSVPSDDNEGAQTGTKIVSRVGVLFFVRVNGPTEQSGQLTDFRILGGDTYMQSGPVTFEILFQNTGTVHLVPYGEVLIKNLFGKQIAKLPVDAYFSLPKSTRYRQITLGKETLLGRYTAEVHLKRGYDDMEDVAKISFWVIPWLYFGIAAGLLIVLFFLWKFITSRFEFKKKEKKSNIADTVD